MRKLQIGVMGSAADLKYSREISNLAEQVGAEIANNNCVTIFGAEKDCDSLSTAAARGAKENGGTTVGITYGQGKKIWGNNSYADVVIVTGLERGGGREFILVNSCDVIIAISGGSGTLNEIAIAYQLNIPIVVLTNTGGWASQLANQYLDTRKRLKIIPASEPKEAVALAIELGKKSSR